MSFPCSWRLHPTLDAHRSNGFVILTGSAWTRAAGCPAKVALSTGRTSIAAVRLDPKGAFRYAWRAPAGRHVVVARVECRGGAELFEASLVLR